VAPSQLRSGPAQGLQAKPKTGKEFVMIPSSESQLNMTISFEQYLKFGTICLF
jgi:hypothetical protein